MANIIKMQQTNKYKHSSKYASLNNSVKDSVLKTKENKLNNFNAVDCANGINNNEKTLKIKNTNFKNVYFIKANNLNEAKIQSEEIEREKENKVIDTKKFNENKISNTNENRTLSPFNYINPNAKHNLIKNYISFKSAKKIINSKNNSIKNFSSNAYNTNSSYANNKLFNSKKNINSNLIVNFSNKNKTNDYSSFNNNYKNLEIKVTIDESNWELNPKTVKASENKNNFFHLISDKILKPDFETLQHVYGINNNDNNFLQMIKNDFYKNINCKNEFEYF